MPPLADREQHESAIIADMAPVFEAQYRRAAASPHRIPYDEFERGLQAVLARDLKAIFQAAGFAMANGIAIVVTDGAIEQTADRWAADKSRELATGIVNTSREMAAAAVEKAGGDKQRLREALAVVFLSDARLRNIAVTETTGATSAGEHAIAIPYNALVTSPGLQVTRRAAGQDEDQDEAKDIRDRIEEEASEASKAARTHGARAIPGNSIISIRDAEGRPLIPIWRIDPNSNVCEHCLPLNGHSQEVWGLTYPMGPPGHVNCRCSIAWVEAAEFARRAA